MKLREIDEKLYELDVGDIIKAVNLGIGIKKLGKDGVKLSALNYIKNNLPKFLDAAGDKIAQSRRHDRNKNNTPDPETQR